VAGLRRGDGDDGQRDGGPVGDKGKGESGVDEPAHGVVAEAEELEVDEQDGGAGEEGDGSAEQHDDEEVLYVGRVVVPADGHVPDVAGCFAYCGTVEVSKEVWGT